MKTKDLNRIVGRWRRNRERHKKLTPAPQPAPMPAETRESSPGTEETAA